MATRPRRHNTEIEWTHPPGFTGETWNPTTGCTKVSPACAHCYAELLSRRFKISPPFLPGQYRLDLHPDRLAHPMRWPMPRCIFVDSISDLFHEDVPFDFIDQVMAVVMLCQHHIFQVLTKRPQVMLEYFKSNPLPRIRRATYGFQSVTVMNGHKPWSERIAEVIGQSTVWPFANLWLGVSAENQEWADRRLGMLLRIPARIHFVSAEPLLGPIDFTKISCNPDSLIKKTQVGLINNLNSLTGEWDYDTYKYTLARLDWVIVGGESGNKVRLSHPQWFRDIRDDCQDHEIPFFMKQWGSWGIVQEAVPMERINRSRIEDITYAMAEGGLKFHMRAGLKTKALCGFEPRREQPDATIKIGWEENISLDVPDDNQICRGCLVIGKPTIRYARLDPRDNRRQPSNLIIETDVPMRRMGKQGAGAELDGKSYREFPDLTYYSLATAVANPSQDFHLALADGGTQLHIKLLHENIAICRFRPKIASDGTRKGGHWKEVFSYEQLQSGQSICGKCSARNEGKTWLSRFAT